MAIITSSQAIRYTVIDRLYTDYDCFALGINYVYLSAAGSCSKLGLA